LRNFTALPLVLFLAVVAHPVRAASFDCAKASSASERLICGDAKLSEIDGKLDTLYRERIALLSPRGADLLRQSQRSWLTFANRTCLSSRDKRNNYPTSCLLRRYEERLKDLLQAGQQVGPFRFNRVDLYTLRPAKDESGLAPGFLVRHFAYPQIDNPDSPATIAWNARQAKRTYGGYCEGSGDDQFDFEIGHATARFISLQWTAYSYCHGAAHGLYTARNENVLLEPSLRDATGEDVFGAAGTWMAPLQALFWNAILAQGWKPPFPKIEGQLKEMAVTPDRWLFTAQGLRFDFNAYEGGCYVCNPESVTISWASLKPLLTPKALVP
jgi:uncharacterized protein